jgi:hypothetical protein
MRTHHVIAIVAVVLVGVGVKATQLSNVQAQYGDGERGRSSNWSSEQTFHVANLPVEKVSDMSFVFSGGDVTTAGIAPAASDQTRKSVFTPRCAERDLRASTAIEEFGQLDAMPTVWLAAAGLSWLQARSLCLAGAENEGVYLYDRIIAGDARLPNDE